MIEQNMPDPCAPDAGEGLEGFSLGEPALICRWRIAHKKLPLLNRHIRALAARSVAGEALSASLLSWAKQHIEWSLAEDSYPEQDGVLMLVVDVDGQAAMSVGAYEPLADTSAPALARRALDAAREGEATGVAPETLCAVSDGNLIVAMPRGECPSGTLSLVEQLAQTKGCRVSQVWPDGGSCDESGLLGLLAGTVMLVSDEHGVVPAGDAGLEGPDGALVDLFVRGLATLRDRA